MGAVRGLSPQYMVERLLLHRLTQHYTSVLFVDPCHYQLNPT